MDNIFGEYIGNNNVTKNEESIEILRKAQLIEEYKSKLGENIHHNYNINMALHYLSDGLWGARFTLPLSIAVFAGSGYLGVSYFLDGMRNSFNANDYIVPSISLLFNIASVGMAALSFKRIKQYTNTRNNALVFKNKINEENKQYVENLEKLEIELYGSSGYTEILKAGKFTY